MGTTIKNVSDGLQLLPSPLVGFLASGATVHTTATIATLLDTMSADGQLSQYGTDKDRQALTAYRAKNGISASTPLTGAQVYSIYQRLINGGTGMRLLDTLELTAD